MKKVLLFLSLSMILLSCGYETPKLNDPKDPFIVTDIREFNQTHAYYDCKCFRSCTADNFLGSWYATICLPKGLYNLGDTIRIK